MNIKANSPTQTTVLVTGITGFLAGHIAVQLQQQGYRVRGTLRDIRKSADVESRLRSAAGISTSEFDVVEANLDRAENWEAAVAGCKYVIHTASPFPFSLNHSEDDLIRTARDGALRVLQAAHRADVHRVVLTSSIAATNHGSGQPPYTEDDWTDIQSPRATPYYKSKTLAEQAAWEFAVKSGLELSVINPSMILGPLLGPEYGTSVGLIQKLMCGKFRGLPRFGFSIVDVRDVADAHLKAMTHPDAAGQRFIVGGRFLWLRELRNILAELFPEYAHKLPKKEVPDWFVRFMAHFDASARMIVHELHRDLSVNADKAHRILGWHSRPEQEAIRASAQSLIDLGMVTVG
jgi:nucleoside-diphosphate-sugar epimerase